MWLILLFFTFHIFCFYKNWTVLQSSWLRDLLLALGCKTNIVNYAFLEPPRLLNDLRTAFKSTFLSKDLLRIFYIQKFFCALVPLIFFYIEFVKFAKQTHFYVNFFFCSFFYLFVYFFNILIEIFFFLSWNTLVYMCCYIWIIKINQNNFFKFFL